MNGKIVLSISISFLFTFGILFALVFFPETTYENNFKENFFSQKFDSNTQNIFLIGSSHLGHLNSTLIIEQLKQKNENYDVYNLALNGDTPKIRFDSINNIISLKPEIVFYGISFRDFESQKKIDADNITPEIKFIIRDHLTEELESINPQLITRRAIRDFLNDTEIVNSPVYDIRQPNSPFFSLGDLQTQIVDETKLHRLKLSVLPSPVDLHIDSVDNEQVIYFKKIIQKLHDNNIKVVIFATPIHEIYRAELNDETEKTFYQILDEISNEFDLNIYDFTNKYSKLPVWNNLDHIAYNENSMIFSEDVLDMIILELDS